MKTLFSMTKNKESKSKEVSQISRRQLFKKGGMLAGAISALSLTPFSWVEASAQAAIDDIQVIDLTGTRADKYVRATINSAEYQQFSTDLNTQYSNTFTVREDSPVVVLFKMPLEQIVSVHIPIQGGAGHSFFAATLQEHSASLIATRSGVLMPVSNGNTTAIVKQNGNVVLDALITPKGNFAQGTFHTTQGKNITFDGLSAKEAASLVTHASSNANICCVIGGLVEIAGISLVLVPLIVPLCGAACAVTLGAGCIACVAGATGLGGFLVGAVVDNCSHNRNYYIPVC